MATPTVSLTITRASLSLSPLVVTNTPGSRWIPEDGVARPGRIWRHEFADSEFVHGGLKTSAKSENSTLQVVLYHQGTTDANLDSLVAATEAALFQPSFSVTLAIGSRAPLTYRAWEADVDPGPLDSGMVREHMERIVATIPVYPIPGS